jgi:photosystem II stability/assembly factor-like uncharacterized protein
VLAGLLLPALVLSALAAPTAARGSVPAPVPPLRPAPPAPLWHAPHDPLNSWAISPDFARDRTLFVGENAYGIVLRSRDGGATFTAINGGLDSGYLQALAISPDFARDRLLLAADGGRLFRTQDAGDRWEALQTPPLHGVIASLAISPDFARDRTLAIGAGRGDLLVSRDAGASWEPLELPTPASIQQILFSPGYATDGTVLLRAPPDRIFASSDGGRTFAARPGPPSAVISSLLLDDRYAESGTLWAATVGDGVWRSTDRGATWDHDGEGFRDGAVLHLAAARDDEGRRVIFAATVSDGIWLRRDEGAWLHDGKGLRQLAKQSEKHYFAAVPSPDYANDRTVFAITFEGLQVSRDGGHGWEHLQTLPGTWTFFAAFSPRFETDTTLWVTTNGMGTLLSRDAGRRWQRLNTGKWAFPDGIAVAPDYPDEPHILVGSPRELLLSRDDGASFFNCLPDRPGFLHVAAFAPDYARTGTIYMHNIEFQHTEQNAFLRSDDRGESWVDTGPPTIHGLAFAPDFPDSGRLYVATERDVQVSPDRGRSWSALAGLPAARWVAVSAAPAPATPQAPAAGDALLAASGNAGVFLSRDGGASWTPLDGAVDGLRLTGAALSPGFAEDGLCFALSQNEGLFVRTPDTAWRALGPDSHFGFSFALSPAFARDHTLVVCTYAGAWMSRDAGASWSLLDLFGGRPGVPPANVPAPPAKPGARADAPEGGGR